MNGWKDNKKDDRISYTECSLLKVVVDWRWWSCRRRMRWWWWSSSFVVVVVAQCRWLVAPEVRSFRIVARFVRPWRHQKSNFQVRLKSKREARNERKVRVRNLLLSLPLSLISVKSPNICSHGERKPKTTREVLIQNSIQNDEVYHLLDLPSPSLA